MGTLKTLGQIVAHLKGGAESLAEAKVPDGVKAERSFALEEGAGNGRGDAVRSIPPYHDAEYQGVEYNNEAGWLDVIDVEKKNVVPIPQPFEAGIRITIPEGRPVFITEDASGLSKAVAAALEAHGILTVGAPPEELLEWKEVYAAGGLVILADAWETQDARFLQEAFTLAHRLGPDLSASGQEGGGLFATISRLDGAFGFKGGGVEAPFPGRPCGPGENRRRRMAVGLLSRHRCRAELGQHPRHRRSDRSGTDPGGAGGDRP